MSLKKSFTLLLLSLVLEAFCNAFELKDVISPVAGTWENLQSLVLNTEYGSEVYYSLSGTDPLISGFAYDGPVLIPQTGTVDLWLTSVSSDQVRKDFHITYHVQQTLDSESSSVISEYISSIDNSTFVVYTSGTDFVIPSGLKYSFNGTYYKEGGNLSLNVSNGVERFAPFYLTDGTRNWHFVINIISSPLLRSSYTNTADSLPFIINNWDTLIYTSSYYIYQIDDGDWFPGSNNSILDRSIPHVIRWQSVNYEENNIVEEFYLASKPVISKNIENGIVSFFVNQDDKYELSSCGIRGKSICVDAFETEDISGSVNFVVYYDGLMQGSIAEEYSIDKIPPAAPVITSSSNASYARDKVELEITGDSDSIVLYSLSLPVESENGFQDISAAYFDDVSTGEFELFDGNTLVLKSLGDKASFYKVKAFAVDKSGNKSSVTEYRVVVDEFNYYLYCGGLDDENSYFASAVTSNPDGSFTNPFTSFAQALKVINSNQFTKLHIIGEVTLGSGTSVIKKDCMIIGNDSRIIFPSSSSIELNKCKVDFSGFIFEKTNQEESSESSLVMFNLIKSNLKFEDCEIVGIFGHSGIIFDSSNSVLAFDQCGITIQTDDYGCIISSVNSDIRVEQCRMSTVSPNCVNISAHGGSCSLIKSSCSLIGKIGRAVELVKAKLSMESNVFKVGNTVSSPYLSAVWKDDDSIIDKDIDNKFIGFE